MTALAEQLLQDIDKDTVDFIPNFDESSEEPVVLPSVFPNLLVNGADGIVFTRIFKHIGDKISPPSTNHDRIGVIIASGKNAAQAVENAAEAEKKMNIRMIS